MQVARVYLDVETTGLDPAYHSVIEVGAVAVDAEGHEIGHYQSLCNPGDWAMKNSEPKAFEVNRIDPDEVRAARPITSVAGEFLAWLDKRAVLHAFPVVFEDGFLKLDPWNILEKLWGECVQEAARSIMSSAGALPYKFGKPKLPKLSEAATFFKVEPERLHRALADARTTALVYEVILRQRTLDPSGDEVEKIMKDGL